MWSKCTSVVPTLARGNSKTATREEKEGGDSKRQKDTERTLSWKSQTLSNSSNLPTLMVKNLQ